MGLALGFRDNDDEPLDGVAVGGETMQFRLRTITLRIGAHAITARIGWLRDDNTEALVGRLDVFDAFHFDFRQSERKLVVTPAPG